MGETMAKKKKNTEKNIGTSIIEIPVNINFKVNAHSKSRFLGRNLSENKIVEIVKSVLSNVIANEDDKTKQNIKFYVCDKQTCLVAQVLLKNGLEYKYQNALIQTAWIFDGKYGQLPARVYFVNEDNPSPEFEEAEQVAEWYGHLATNGGSATNKVNDFINNNYKFNPDFNKGELYGDPTSYKGWDKSFDSERKGIKDRITNRREQLIQRDIDKMYKQKEDDANQRKEHDSELLWNSLPKWKANNTRKLRDWQKYDTRDALRRADTEILTPYGPNGSLRGIDRKRKKLAQQQQQESINKTNTIQLTENELKSVIMECVKRILQK